MRSKLAFFLLVLCVAACRPDPPAPPDPVLSAERIFILNEGNFQRGNATLDLYNPEAQTLESGVFSRINNEPVGDVLQSITHTEEAIYLIVNNGQHVKVLDPLTLTQTERIDSLTSPRYLLPISDGKAYVSDLYANAISVVDLKNNSLTGSIPLTGWTEEMIMSGGSVYATNLRKPWLYQIDPGTDQVVDSLSLAAPAGKILRHSDGNLWLAAPYDPVAQTGGYLFEVDPDQNKLLRQYIFPAETGPSDIAFHPTQDSLYYLTGEGLFVFPLAQMELPRSPFIQADGALFYGMGVDPNNGDIYLADAIDYVQRGIVLRYNTAGELIDEFRTGIIPGAFGFE
ncbi:MAG: DUF5074 domain-containing protein [Bacteroidota bacterium]